MRRRRIRKAPGQISGIDLTPLMDLSFLLLVTFVITFPLVEQHIRVNLPVGKAEASKIHDSRSVTVDAKGIIYLDEAPCSLSELGERMETAAKQNPEVTVMVRGDEALQYGKITQVLKTLKDAGITRTALVTREE